MARFGSRRYIVLAVVLSAALLALGGIVHTVGVRASAAASSNESSALNEIIDRHIMERQKVEKGRNLFEELLRTEGGKVPAYGTEEYWQRLAAYANPAGELRHQDPQKWELIDAYAYDYYVRNILPPVGPPEKETQQEPSDIRVQSGSYNRSEAVNYAHTYVYDYNPAYHRFSADCTNFVSQCLETGGIPMVDAWWRPWWDKDDWYYYRHGTDAYDSNNDDDWSWSWVKVETLHWHIRSRLGNLVSSPSELQLGDIVQLNLDDSDPSNDHSMIVTKIDDAGNRYVTYHTYDTKDKPLSQIGGTKYYLHITY